MVRRRVRVLRREACMVAVWVGWVLSGGWMCVEDVD